MREIPKLIEQLLDLVVYKDGSDIHLGEGYPPVIRIQGDLLTTEEPALTGVEMNSIKEILLPNEETRNRLDENRELDFSYRYENMKGEYIGRFRVNGFYERGRLNFAIRYIPAKVKKLEDLNIPDVVKKMANMPYGLILVTGPTGCGKSTTLASIVDYINRTRSEHIITVEDPLEYEFENKGSIIKQREVGHDTISFANALRSIVREDPDVILVGEMRDRETVSSALTAAETGHLVLSTLHTNNAYQTINRILDIFPAHQQAQIRTQLSTSLIGVISQRLVKGIKGGRLPIFELMICNDAIKNLIKEGNIHELESYMQTGGQEGMISMSEYAKRAIREGKIDAKEVKKFITE